MDKLVMIFALAFAVLQAASVYGENCPDTFLRYNKRHSYCKPENTKCKLLRNLVTDWDVDIILMEMNRMREAVARGEVEEIKGMPAAGNMLQLEWDDNLAAVAQKHAEQCVFKHDCADCRRTINFAVGQNVAMEIVSKQLNPPEADWFAAIDTWWNEIKATPPKVLRNYEKHISSGIYAHYTQLIWANTWKVGCGFAMFEDGRGYNKFYVCNFGPEGNLVQESVYEEGEPCSKCPENTCCGDECEDAEYPTLCKVIKGKRPSYKPPEGNFFYCNFEGQEDCNIHINGLNKWKAYDTLSGNFFGIVLNPGEKSELVFQKHIKPTIPQFCFVMSYRKGPNLDGDEDCLNAIGKYYIMKEKQAVEQPLKNYLGIGKHRFNRFGVTFDWDLETEVSVNLSVPVDCQAQYFEITELYGLDGPCEK